MYCEFYIVKSFVRVRVHIYMKEPDNLIGHKNTILISLAVVNFSFFFSNTAYDHMMAFGTQKLCHYYFHVYVTNTNIILTLDSA